jgi:hypothetical protein
VPAGESPRREKTPEGESELNKLCLSALTLAAAAGAASAQVDPTRFGIEVTPVLRTYTDNGDGTLTATDRPSGFTVDTRSGASTVRLELRYRITVSGSATGAYTVGSSTYSSGGLASTSVNINMSTPLSAGASLSTAPIGNNAGAGGGPNTGSGFSNPDAGIDPGSGFGMYAPWRTGVVPPDDSFGGNNGVRIANTIDNILPLATSAPDQRSTGPSRTWSVYAVDLDLPANYLTPDPSGMQVITFSVVRGVSNGTPAPFLFFPRINNSNSSTAIEGLGQYSTGSVTLTIIGVPAPASAALLGVGGLVAARRRR